MKKTIFGLILIVLLASLVSAAGTSGNLSEIKQLAKELNGKEIPPPLGTLFGDEKINLHFTMKNGEVLTLGLTTEDKKFKSLVMGELADASLNIYTTEATVQKITASKNSAQALKEALDDKKITYKAVGLFNKVKFGFLNIMMKFVSEKAAEEEKKPEVKKEVKAEEKAAKTETKTETKETKSAEKETTKAESANKTKEKTETSNSLTGGAVAEIKKPTGPQTHIVKLIEDGFEVDSITVKVGDKVEWHNTRYEGKIPKALVVGVQKCNKIKSSFFMPGEYFSWTFDKEETCVIVDGIYSTQLMKVIVTK